MRPPIAAHLLATIAVLVAALAPRSAAAEPRHAAIIVDANSGAVLHEQAADELRHPASLTKMMTLYMAFELIEMGRLNYSTKIKVTEEAAKAAPTKLDLEPGEEIPLSDAMKALVTKSANDMAIAIAQTIGGSEANFARLMTEKARQLGMKHTVFRNASGLPDDEQVTTARDMITLALHLQDDFPKHYQLFSLRSFTYHGETYRNHNTLLNSYRGTDGIKTGYTRASGFNLVASVRRDGKHLVGAIFGGETAAARNAHLRVLLDRAFLRASTQKTRKPATSPLLVAKAQPARPKPVAVAKAEAVSALVAPQPKPAVRPAATKPAVAVAAATPLVAAPAAPAKTAPPAPAAAPAAAASSLPQAEPQSASVADAAPSLPAGIQVAKVRRVMVAPHLRPTVTAMADPAAPGASPPAPPPATLAAAAPVPAPAAADPARSSETIVAKAQAAAARAPSTFQDQVAALAANITPAAFATEPNPADPIASLLAPAGESAAAPAAAATLAKTAAAAAPVRQQVASAAPLPASYRLAGPAPGNAPPQPQPKSGGFQIQIGAYGTAAEAERQISTVSASAAPVVGGHVPLTLPVAKGNRQLYRARFAGYDANAAAGACLELRRRQIDCFVMKAE